MTTISNIYHARELLKERIEELSGDGYYANVRNDRDKERKKLKTISDKLLHHAIKLIEEETKEI